MDFDRAREAVAQEYGFTLFRSYSEKTAAAIFEVDYSTLKRWRRAGRVPHVSRGSGVHYMGYQIADFLLVGVRAMEIGSLEKDFQGSACPRDSNKNLSSSVTGSAAGQADRDGTDAGSKVVRSDVSHLAQTILTRRRKD